MDTDIDRKPKSFLKDKILRFKPIVFLKKNIFLFSFLVVFSLTFVFKVWDLKKYEINELGGNDIDQKVYLEIEKYINENILNNNYFSFSPVASQRDMYMKIPQLKSIKIEKIAPNKIVLFVEIYKPKYVANLKSSSCYILSSDGFVLENICNESIEGCCMEYSAQNNIPFLSSSSVDVSSLDNGKSRLLIMEDIEKVAKVVETFKYEISSIILENNILEVKEKEGKLFRFTMTDDIITQIKRYIIVVSKIKGESLDFQSLDLRFERPVMKN